MQTTKEQREELRREIKHQRMLDNGYFQNSSLRLDLLDDIMADADRLEAYEVALRKIAAMSSAIKNLHWARGIAQAALEQGEKA